MNISRPSGPSFKSSDLRVGALVECETSYRITEHAVKLLAGERLPELTDELRRRSFTDVTLLFANEHYARIEARIVRAQGEVQLDIMPSLNGDRPYVVRIAIDDADTYTMAVRGRELTFEAALQVVDDFLAGFVAGQRIG